MSSTPSMLPSSLVNMNTPDVFPNAFSGVRSQLRRPTSRTKSPTRMKPLTPIPNPIPNPIPTPIPFPSPVLGHPLPVRPQSETPAAYNYFQTPPASQPSPGNRRRTINGALVGGWKLGEEIGRGATAIVYKGIETKSGRFAAIKRFQETGLTSEIMNVTQAEVQTIKNLAHPNIISFYTSIRENSYFFIVMEWVENCLQNLLKNFGTFPEELISAYTQQILSGLHYLHSVGIIHRDIKSSNVLITKQGIIKLADFGAAAQVKSESERHFTVAGSPYWMAPEVIEVEGHSYSSDIWSVGCTIIEMVAGQPPYYEKPPLSAMYSISHDPLPPLPPNISQDLSNLLTKCFIKDPQERPSAQTLLQDDWILRFSSGARESIKRTIKTYSTINMRSKSKAFPVISLNSRELNEIELEIANQSEKTKHYFTQIEMSALQAMNEHVNFKNEEEELKYLRENLANTQTALCLSLSSKLDLLKALDIS
eukprot:TRINITY_DN1646_c0_g1_i3.p1 TRINITY_DN1646_c0_g1~~TRINITY_DN1646_c0_g1_i3.p1  ORF type:complete len:479 (-),score=88.64 TRINITY_DN1646_c0_g1_i3:50-1486(-)